MKSCNVWVLVSLHNQLLVGCLFTSLTPASLVSAYSRGWFHFPEGKEGSGGRAEDLLSSNMSCSVMEGHVGNLSVQNI